MLPKLQGRLWHTTHPDRFQGILNCGAILPEPPIPATSRWKTARGQEGYPYVRTIGGVSLFDFDRFQPQSYSIDYPLSTWRTFIPFREDWGTAIWIEINRAQITHQLISATDLLARWKADGAYGNALMPCIEAAVIGELPASAFLGAFVVNEGDYSCRPLTI